jgi:hypothetical protein
MASREEAEMKRRWIVMIGIGSMLALAACPSKQSGGSGGGGGSTAAGAGKERGACYGNGTCDKGLVCLSELCVAPPGADCAAIADHLGGLLLGNYAPREERAGFVAEITAECTKEKLTREAGECLLRAEGRQAIGGCPTPLGVGDCAKIVPHLKAMLATAGGDPYLVTPADRLVGRCKNEVPSKALEVCALAAKKPDELERCTW